MVASGFESGNNRGHTNGTLPVAASQISGSRPGTVKLHPKLKVVIRRLPPGLTETEFTSILGHDWKLGNGRVDWLIYKTGKDSKDPSKPSRPSSAYLHLVNEAHLRVLAEVVRQTVFEDALATFTSPCLVSSPTVEFAPYGRIPSGRKRVDARAGTIDQDLEFMAFLEALANPVSTKEANAETIVEGSGKRERVTTTPLVQFLKDRKANKSKEAAVKLAKKQESQTKNKAVKETPSTEDSKKKPKEVKVDKSVEKAAKEAVKILNREAASKSAVSQSSTTPDGSTSQISTPPKLDVTKVPGRQRSAVVAAHIRMLQRDLGLTPAQAHRQVRRDTADAQKAERAAATTTDKVTNESKDPSSSQQQAPIGPSKILPTQPRKPRGKAANSLNSEPIKSSPSSTASPAPPTPVVLLRKPDPQQSSPATTGASPSVRSTPTAPISIARKPQLVAPPVGATQAFVKHANPSQGVTEALLKEAMEKFGAVSMVEIDKRKGFAYVDFVNSDGLKKAMAANPIPVAQGTVQVMQRKGTALPPEKKPIHQPQLPPPPSRGNVRGGRGGSVGRRGGRGGRGGAAGPSESRAPSTAPTGPAAK